MARMMLNGILHCLLFMLTSAAIVPQRNLTTDLQMDGMESRVDIEARGLAICRDDLLGRCISNGDPCHEQRDYGLCGGYKKCCYPRSGLIGPEECQKTGECFFQYTSNQCFCYIDSTGTPLNWFEATDLCESNGWQLPHPVDVVALRDGLFQECGNCGDFWLDAGYFSPPANAGMYWQDVTDVEITCNNPYFSGPPNTCPLIGLGDCLNMNATAVAILFEPNRPYSIAKCSTAKQGHILCQRK